MPVKFKYFFLSLLSAVTLFSCGSDDDYDCFFQVTPYIQLERGGADSLNLDIWGYYFYADTVDFYVDSYEMAASGTIAAKDGSGTVQASGTPVKKKEGTLNFPGINQGVAMIVLFDEGTGIYCWRPLYVEKGMPFITTKIRFRTWRSGQTYKESGWTVVVPLYPEEEEEIPDESGGEEEGAGENEGEDTGEGENTPDS